MVDATPKQIGLSRLLLGARKLAPLLASSLALLLLMSPNPVLNGSGHQPDGRPPPVTRPSVQDDEPPPITEANPEGLEVPSESLPPESTVIPSPIDRSHLRYSYHPLKMAAGMIGDEIYVGPVGIGSSGCSFMDSVINGTEILVRGVARPTNVMCTAIETTPWSPIRLESEQTVVSIGYQGKKGAYRVSALGNRVDIEFQGGQDVAPVLSPDGWWVIPDEALLVEIFNPNDELALQRTAERIKLRLFASDAEPMEALPEGNPLPPQDPRVTRYYEEYFPSRSDFENTKSSERVRMAYLSHLSDEELYRMAGEEAQLEDCSFIRFDRVGASYPPRSIERYPPCYRPRA